MKRLVRQAGDRLVGLVLPKVEAGACVEVHGQCCKKGYRFSCLGSCSAKVTTCT